MALSRLDQKTLVTTMDDADGILVVVGGVLRRIALSDLAALLPSVDGGGGAAIPDWADMPSTPTLSITTGLTVTEAKYREIGEETECRILVECTGAWSPTGVALTLDLPTGWEFDFTTWPGLSDYAIGQAQISDTGSTRFYAYCKPWGDTNPSTLYVLALKASTTYVEYISLTNNRPQSAWAAGDNIAMQFRAPITKA